MTGVENRWSFLLQPYLIKYSFLDISVSAAARHKCCKWYCCRLVAKIIHFRADFQHYLGNFSHQKHKHKVGRRCNELAVIFCDY